MPKVVSNTTPIISLLKLGRLAILKELYRKIIIPHQEVYNEMEKGRRKEYYSDLEKLGWFEIKSIKDENPYLIF